MNSPGRYNQPEMVVAILAELGRQNRRFKANPKFYNQVFRLAEQLVEAANRAGQAQDRAA